MDLKSDNGAAGGIETSKIAQTVEVEAKDVGSVSSKDAFLRADKIDFKSWDLQLEKHLSRVWSRDGYAGAHSKKTEEWEIDLGKLDIRNVIAHGTYGTVYRGVYDGQDVAVKLLDWGEDDITTAAETAALRASFWQEVAVWHKLDHPNVTKGSISISMSLHQTSFCFVCSHLTSGQKDGDELRRNSDVAEILRKTRFPRAQSMEGQNSPRTILEHDRIIWLGDLNYRIALSYHCAKALVDMRNWRTLLENDQLRIEQRQGHVFEGWTEGKIYFPPTYKYLKNSDKYAGDDINPKAKRRTPAWCDRILWYGIGLHQISYARGESRFSDHRPVYSTFLAEVESISFSRNKGSLNCSSSRIEVEELLPHLD